jgi:hypothetical protein
MNAHVLEGTVSEVREQLDRLPLPPETRVRLIVQDIAGEGEPPPSRNGIRLIPTRDPAAKVTTDLVLDLLDRD